MFMDFTYEISGKKYIQKPLVIGQFRQLFNLIKNTSIPYSSIDNASSLIALFGDNIHTLIAIVITEEGVKPKDKNVETLAEELEFELSPEDSFKVVEDFFDCNDLPYLLKKIGDLVGKVTEKIKTEETKETGSSN
jgi:hypothetical protein